MNKIKRILALTAAALLVLMYVFTLVAALLKAPYYADLLRASIALTIILPVLLYGYILIYRVLKKKSDEQKAPLNENGNRAETGNRAGAETDTETDRNKTED